MTPVPKIRVRSCNSVPVRPDAEFVLYWMIAFRRTSWNFALDRALEWAEELRKPLVVLECLRSGYRWASDRLQHFIIDGMADNACRLEGTGALHYPYLELEPDAGKGLLRAMAGQACVVVTDDFPCFFLPAMVAAAAQQVPIRMEAVDSNGLLPLRAADRAFSTAHSFRRFLQKDLPLHLEEFPKPDPLRLASLPAITTVPREVSSKWPRASADLLNGDRRFLEKMRIDHRVSPVGTQGGTTAGRKRLREFLEQKQDVYLDERNEPERNATSGLSPYLHFGQVSAHEIFSAVAGREGWSAANLALRPSGRRTGWWGLSPSAEAFLDQLVTWRELGFNFCSQRNADYDQFRSLPAWAVKTLRRHARDEREYVYALEEFEGAGTHDPLWNAAQTQLLREGRIHNYLRMLWGKKILEWTPSAEDALAVMIALNNKYALDGRDPNSYSGIFWCLGRYDRPWGPERPVFGTVRYMSSSNTEKKLDVREYMRQYGPSPGEHIPRRRKQRKAR